MRTYGYTPDDVTALPSGAVAPGVQLTVWDAPTAGAQVLDLLDADGAPLPGYVLSGADGAYGWKHDGTFDYLYASADVGVTRWAVQAHEALTGKLDAQVAATTYALNGGAVQRTLQKLAQNLGDVTLLVLGDSTGNETGEWPDLVTRDLQARYPTFTLKSSTWDDPGSTWPALTTVVAGTGANVIKLYNGSVAGKSFDYALGARFAAMVATIAPDLVFINYGHNEGTNSNQWDQVRDRLLTVTETVRAACPTAELVITSQNPRFDSASATYPEQSGYRAQRMAQVAGMCGYGFVDAHQAFKDTGNAAAYVGPDGLHPNAAGSRLWADAVNRLILQDPGAAVQAQQPSSLLVPTVNLLGTAGDFAGFTPPTVPTGWVQSNATLTKDTTNFESANGYAVRIQPTTNGPAYIRFDGLPLRLLKGQWVTFAVRLRIPAGQSGNAGRLSLADGVSTLTSRSLTDGRDGFAWATVSKQISTTAAYLQAYIYADTGSTTTADISVDRATVVRGLLPRDTR